MVESESEDDGVGDGVGRIVFLKMKKSVKFWKKNFVKRIRDNAVAPQEIVGKKEEYVENLFEEYDNDPGTSSINYMNVVF